MKKGVLALGFLVRAILLIAVVMTVGWWWSLGFLIALVAWDFSYSFGYSAALSEAKLKISADKAMFDAEILRVTKEITQLRLSNVQLQNTINTVISQKGRSYFELGIRLEHIKRSNDLRRIHDIADAALRTVRQEAN